MLPIKNNSGRADSSKNKKALNRKRILGAYIYATGDCEKIKTADKVPPA